MSEDNRLYFHIQVLESKIKKIQTDAKNSQQLSAERDQYFQTIIKYQSYKIQKQAVQIELQKAKIQNITLRYSKYCENMERQMRFLEGMAYRENEVPSPEERGKYPSLTKTSQSSEPILGSEVEDNLRFEALASTNPIRNPNYKSGDRTALVAPLIGLNISSENLSEMPAQGSQK
ncbi:unnamed protein product [Tuber aestivum]|uniref:Uncharacterized protein n=1 Tax=Tuber aestivum TaxID=59557 RepID=A0A292PT63_9PEZI|nr:unnamed protein product [Tuber aestivum]